MSKSLLQGDPRRCWLCGGAARWDDPLDKHHIFGGAMRKKSERDGLWVMLHHRRCHEDGPESAHRSAQVRGRLQAEGQRAWMEVHGAGADEFRAQYHKSYL